MTACQSVEKTCIPCVDPAQLSVYYNNYYD